MVGIEIIIGLFQALELGEIFVMEDGREQTAELAPCLGVARFRDFRVGQERADNVAFADRYEMTARLVSGDLPRHGNVHPARLLPCLNDKPVEWGEGRATRWPSVP